MGTANGGTGKGRYSRRQFVKGFGAGAAGVAATFGLPGGVGQPPGPPQQTAPPPATPVRVGPRPAPPGTELLSIVVNGTPYEVAIQPRWTLAEVLRDQLGLTGTKVGCDRGECGSCTVLLDGKAVLSCLVLAVEAAGQSVTTVEGLATNGKLHPLQQAFWEYGGLQCGFCTPGMLMSAKALLDATPQPTETEIRLAISGNLCRCTGYRKIVGAVLAASGRPPQG